ncbi:hypothetical protein Tco_0684088 [Tanacetum coccineum]
MRLITPSVPLKLKGFSRTGSLPSGCVDLTGDEDPTDEDGDIGMGDSTGVLVSLGGGISSGGKKSQESNIGDSDNTIDGGTTVEGGIVTCGGLNGIICLHDLHIGVIMKK